MARGKAINVKIATPKIIKALETALAKLEKDYSSQEAQEAKYQKAVEAWKKEIGKWAIANAIRILKMTDEETVNTSTYNAVAQYL